MTERVRGCKKESLKIFDQFFLFTHTFNFQFFDIFVLKIKRFISGIKMKS